MKNFRCLKLGLLTWKAIIYRIISLSIFTMLFGRKLALTAGIVAMIVYYIYDWLFHKFFKVSTDKGFVLWFTGLPCSGKSTIADTLVPYLKKEGIKVERLDGDVVRKGKLSDDLGFSKEDRNKNINRVNFIGKLLSRNGVAVLASFVSPYRKTRDNIRKNVTNFIEVYVKASKDECMKRDVKGMYAKAIKGEIKNFTGYSAPYESPSNPEITCNTDKETIKESTCKIIDYLKEKRLL